MKHLITVATCLAAAVCMAAGDLPQIDVREWTDSLDIVDVDGAAASLNYARIIDSKVNGSVPAHDSAYDSWKMDFVVRFDRAIRKSGDVTLYGQIRSDNSAWSTIEHVLGKQKSNCWHSLQIPAKEANAETQLLQTMLVSDEWSCTVRYNDGIADALSAGLAGLVGAFNHSTEYKLNFTKLIETFYCGIAFRSREYLGTTCTIDVVLINPKAPTDRRTLATIKYRYDEGKYGDDAPGKWFNTRIGWYDQLPRDLDKCHNCSVTNYDDYLELAGPGRLDSDGTTLVAALSRPQQCRSYPATVKRLVVVLEADSTGWTDYDRMVGQFEASPLYADYERTAACFGYVEDGVTNLAGLVRTPDGVNRFAKLVPSGTVDFSGNLECVIVVKRYSDDVTYVSYGVNGVYFTHEGRRDIPVVGYTVQDRLAVEGTAVVRECYGDMERLPAGHAMHIE